MVTDIMVFLLLFLFFPERCLHTHRETGEVKSKCEVGQGCLAVLERGYGKRW